MIAVWDGMRVQFVMLDTIILTGNSDLPSGRQLLGSQMPGPTSQQAADDQWAFVRALVPS